MEDLEWKLQLKQNEVAHAYREVEKLEDGNSDDLAKARVKLEELLLDDAALAFVILELELPPHHRDSTSLSIFVECLWRVVTC